MITKYQLNHFKNNWKLIIHLLFRTYHFGVNNKWWFGDYRAFFGVSWWKLRKWNIVQNYRMIRYRCSPGIGFITAEECSKLFPKYYKELYGKYKKPDYEED